MKKKGWRYKKCVIKQKPKIQDYNNCLKAARKGRTKNYLEKKIRINIDSIKKNSQNKYNKDLKVKGIMYLLK